MAYITILIRPGRGPLCAEIDCTCDDRQRPALPRSARLHGHARRQRAPHATVWPGSPRQLLGRGVKVGRGVFVGVGATSAGVPPNVSPMEQASLAIANRSAATNSGQICRRPKAAIRYIRFSWVASEHDVKPFWIGRAGVQAHRPRKRLPPPSVAVTSHAASPIGMFTRLLSHLTLLFRQSTPAALIWQSISGLNTACHRCGIAQHLPLPVASDPSLNQL